MNYYSQHCNMYIPSSEKTEKTFSCLVMQQLPNKDILMSRLEMVNFSPNFLRFYVKKITLLEKKSLGQDFCL